ncbi:MAG: NAD(P)/FAD-dependent oxidoreductase [Bacteroidales bacterium]|jgi:predicted Rossmann fold flavoprotein|nr:NAD(P)/FAD-dependent oxidoreductase [Bacteroidales bacterium]NCU37160.1 NAD(P)/FAD-dependent oxidoreductase [Candidatus Falkowbacteria bacterium]MDD2632940.1 NAD(P)/FAD-dependent oxidoreductase [Bacteroidales bacterium]MDD3527726.1 NAD(P)/FAD-dependent oxidoreductase [Bacteroidales bacterium]MDD4176803.1 NAD(P)/FAD-dependent oxidoreductase [Bacteroidales bacterium]
MNKYDVIVIGAGPAGLLAAGRAAELGGRVLVLEKMRQPGRKLLISGKGRCNVTNDATLSEFIKHIFPNGRFLKNAFGHFFSGDLIALLQSQGVEVTLERGGRYFPASNKSADVLQALLGWLTALKVEIRTGHRVEKLIIEDNAIKGLEANGQTFLAKNIVLATGGKSYPATGSNGEGYLLARQAGHSLVSPRPALVPIETSGTLAQQLQGLTLKNVKAVVWINGKKAGEDFGEMLFTHFGLSGPIILTLSRIIVDALQQKHSVEVSIDLKPALDEQKLDLRLLRDLNEHGKKNFANMLRSWLPASMVPVFIELLQIKPDKECHQVNAQERKKIRVLLKDFRLQVSNHRPFKEAIITAGGIPTAEIVSKSMESKLVKGLFFAGEIIDLDAETGGYNLQIAFSTGWLAGNSIHL